MGRPLQEADLHTARLSQHLLGFAGFCLGYQNTDSCEIIAAELLSVSIECKPGRVHHYSGVTSHQSEPPDMPGIRPGPLWVWVGRLTLISFLSSAALKACKLVGNLCPRQSANSVFSDLTVSSLLILH